MSAADVECTRLRSTAVVSNLCRAWLAVERRLSHKWSESVPPKLLPRTLPFPPTTPLPPALLLIPLLPLPPLLLPPPLRRTRGLVDEDAMSVLLLLRDRPPPLPPRLSDAPPRGSFASAGRSRTRGERPVIVASCDLAAAVGDRPSNCGASHTRSIAVATGDSRGFVACRGRRLSAAAAASWAAASAPPAMGASDPFAAPPAPLTAPPPAPPEAAPEAPPATRPPRSAFASTRVAMSCAFSTSGFQRRARELMNQLLIWLRDIIVESISPFFSCSVGYGKSRWWNIQSPSTAFVASGKFERCRADELKVLRVRSIVVVFCARRWESCRLYLTLTFSQEGTRRVGPRFGLLRKVKRRKERRVEARARERTKGASGASFTRARRWALTPRRIEEIGRSLFGFVNPFINSKL